MLVAPKRLRVGMLGYWKMLMGTIWNYHIRGVFKEMVALVWG